MFIFLYWILIPCTLVAQSEILEIQSENEMAFCSADLHANWMISESRKSLFWMLHTRKWCLSSFQPTQDFIVFLFASFDFYLFQSRLWTLGRWLLIPWGHLEFFPSAFWFRYPLCFSSEWILCVVVFRLFLHAALKALSDFLRLSFTT